MGRRGTGIRKRANGGDNWYLCLHVPKALHGICPVKELWASLGTADYQLALSRREAAYRGLQARLVKLTQAPTISDAVEAHRGAVYIDDDEPMIAEDVLELINPPKDMRGVVLDSLRNNAPLPLTWHQLAEQYIEFKARKRGYPLSKAALYELNRGIELLQPIVSIPSSLTKQHVRQAVATLREQGLADKSVQTRLSMVASLISYGIKDDHLELSANPFKQVDYSVSQASTRSYRSLTEDELKQLLTAKHSDYWYILIGTGLRIGELASRTPEHIDGDMLMINATDNWKPKTSSSYRRVPLNNYAKATLLSLPMPSRDTLQRRLTKELKLLPSYDSRCVVHSTRHTYKTLARKVGIPADISDEITGHAKTTVSRVSSGYGMYPDSTLLTEGVKIWMYLDGLNRYATVEYGGDD